MNVNIKITRNILRFVASNKINFRHDFLSLGEGLQIPQHAGMLLSKFLERVCFRQNET